MVPGNWIERRITDSAQRVLKQILPRALDRGLALRIVDEPSIVMLALWTVLLWERKLGLAALEEAGVSRFDLVRGLDKLLQENTSELPLAFDKQHAIVSDKHQNAVVVGKTGHSDGAWDFEDLLEPVIRQAEHEANELGHNYVGSEHLVLALVKLADPLLATLLKQHGVTYEKVREAVVRLLQPDKPTPLVD
jgi:hypothetical protein